MRKAGCAVLGIITEGCKEQIKALFESIIPQLIVLTTDSQDVVRECACFAIGQFSEHCQPEILHYHQTILPAIFNCLDDTSNTVKGISCYVCEMLCENLEPNTLRPFVGPLMNKFFLIFQNCPRSSKEIVLAAIAATAVAAELDFLPYASHTIEMLKPLIFLTEPENFEVRGRALECFGHIAIAIGTDNFLPYFDIGLQSVIQAIQINDENLKEFSYIYIANAAKACNNGFNVHLPSLVGHLLDVIRESEAELIDGDDSEDDDEEQNQQTQVSGQTTNENEEEDDNDYNDYKINATEGFINTKKAALTALGALAQYSKDAFNPYLEQSIHTILDDENGSFQSFHAIVRGESICTIKYFVTVAKSCSEYKDLVVTKGQMLNIPNGSILQKVTQTVMNVFMKDILVDEEKDCVAEAIAGIEYVVKELGMAGILVPDETGVTPMAQNVMKIILEILSEKLPCQQAHEDNDDEDDNDHDDLVMDSTIDLIGCLAKMIGNEFVPYFDEFYKQLLKFMKPSRSYSDRSMAIGCFAEVLAEIGYETSKYLEYIVPYIQVNLQDPIEGVRRNAAYCIAAIVESMNTTLNHSQILQFLNWLSPLCHRDATKLGSDVGGADVDNALSAVARMITRIPGSVPLEQVLPVMLNALPIRSDPLEGTAVYSCLLQLITNQDPVAINLLPQILHVLGQTLLIESKAISIETKSLIQKALKEYSLSNQLQGLISNALSQISEPEIVQAIHNAVL